MSPDPALQRFVRTLLRGGEAARNGETYVAPDGQAAGTEAVTGLIQSGALSGDAGGCRANAQTRGWVQRARLEATSLAAQHQILAPTAAGTQINLAESPLSRLGLTGEGRRAFLDPHHVEAGERVRRLVERAQLQPRVTMSYSTSRTAGYTPQVASDISDMAADARRRVNEIHRLLPRDCAGVVLDVCGWLKGLQEVERERGWPRRSAKLVLRIGLDQLAQHYGLGPFAVGEDSRRARIWRGEGARPTTFA